MTSGTGDDAMASRTCGESKIASSVLAPPPRQMKITSTSETPNSRIASRSASTANSPNHRDVARADLHDVFRIVDPVEEVSTACSSVSRRNQPDSPRPVGKRKRSVGVDPVGLAQLYERGVGQSCRDGSPLQDGHARSDELKWAMTRVNLESPSDGDLSVLEDGTASRQGHRRRASDR